MAFAQALVYSPPPAKHPLKLKAKSSEKEADSFVERGKEAQVRNSILEPMEVHLVETVKLNLKSRGIGLPVFSAQSVSHSQRPVSSEKPLSPTVTEFRSPMSSGRYSSPKALMSSRGKSREASGPYSISSPLRPKKLSTAYLTLNSKSSPVVPMSPQAILGYISRGLNSVEQGTKLMGEIEQDMSSMHKTLALAERYLESRKATRQGATSSSNAAIRRPPLVIAPQEITPADIEIEEEEDEGMMMPPPPASASRAGSHQI
jgi:hypothetical protein